MLPKIKAPSYTAAMLAGCMMIGLLLLLPGAATAQAANGTLELKVINADGEPIDGAEVRVNDESIDKTEFNNDLIEGEATVETDSDGRFRNASVPVGVKNITVGNPGDSEFKYESQYHESVAILIGETTTEQFTLERKTRTVTGQVFSNGRDPAPISDATVEVTNITKQQRDLIRNSDSLRQTATTNDVGEYRIDIPTSTGLNLSFSRDGYKSTEVVIGSDDSGEVINNLLHVLENQDGVVFGTVTVDNNGEVPVSGAVIKADVNPANWAQIDEADISDTTGSDGAYRIRAPSGRHTVIVESETFNNKKKEVTVRPNEANETNFSLGIRQLQIDSVTPQTVQSGDTVTIDYTYSGQFETLNFTVGPENQPIISQEVDDAVSSGKITFETPDRSEIEDGNYTITLSTPRRTATDTIRVLNPVDPEAVGVGELGEESYRAPAGDFVEITTGGEYMLIGGDRPSDNSDTITQYLDVLYVEEGSTTINTRLVGTAVPSDRAYGEGVKSYAHSIGADSEPRGDFADVSFTGASTLAEFRRNLGIDSRATPLQTGRYRLLAGENGRITVDSGVPRFRKPVGRSNLILTQPQLEAVNTYVLPPESANAEDVAGPSDDATESNTIAEGERLLIEIQATGMYGAITDDPTAESIPPAAIADLLAKPEGVDMDLSTWYYDGSENTEADLQFSAVSPSDVYVIPDTTTDQWEDETVIGEDSLISGLYIVVDTRGEAFSAPAYGDVMQFTTAYESPDGSRYLYQDTDAGTQPRPFDPAIESADGVEHYPYFGATDTTVAVNSTVEFMEPSIQYGRTTVDGSLVVPAETGGQILGSTTLAPGTQATIQLIDQSRSDPELVTIDEVTIEDDRTFTASADFSELASGDQVTVEFYTAGRLPGNRVIDRRGARVVEDINNIANYQITNFSGTVAVQQRSSLSEVEATINNTGELTGQQVVRFSIDGKPIRNESLRLSGNGNATLDLSDQFVTLPVGTYEYTVRTDNDEQTGELRVASPESGTTITSEDTNTTTTSSPLDENELPGENDDESDPNGLFGIVGVSGRDVALGAALTGTAHVLGYWT